MTARLLSSYTKVLLRSSPGFPTLGMIRSRTRNSEGVAEAFANSFGVPRLLDGGHTRIWILSFQKRKFEPQRTRRTQRREIESEMRRTSETVKFSDSSALRFPVSFVFSVSSASSASSVGN